MAKTIKGLIHKYKNRIKELEFEINSLERVSDKLIVARHIMVLEEVINDLEGLKNG